MNQDKTHRSEATAPHRQQQHVQQQQSAMYHHARIARVTYVALPAILTDSLDHTALTFNTQLTTYTYSLTYL